MQILRWRLSFTQFLRQFWPCHSVSDWGLETVMLSYAWYLVILEWLHICLDIFFLSLWLSICFLCVCIPTCSPLEPEFYSDLYTIDWSLPSKSCQLPSPGLNSALWLDYAPIMTATTSTYYLFLPGAPFILLVILTKIAQSRWHCPLLQINQNSECLNKAWTAKK